VNPSYLGVPLPSMVDLRGAGFGRNIANYRYF
jgi:hypothetical protein